MTTLPAAQTSCRLFWDMASVQRADLADHCRSRLQWGAADWPQEGRADSKGALLGGEVMLRLDLMPAFQVHLHNCCQHFAMWPCSSLALNRPAPILHLQSSTPAEDGWSQLSGFRSQSAGLLCHWHAGLNMTTTIVNMHPACVLCSMSALI